jgi:hypothetical protein
LSFRISFFLWFRLTDAEEVALQASATAVGLIVDELIKQAVAG